MGASSTIRPAHITRDPVGDVAHHRQIVGDEQVGEAEPRLQVLEQVEDLRLDRDVERRDRLVADQELGLQRQGAGDADALPLAAGEAVRVAAEVAHVEADRLEQRLTRSTRSASVPMPWMTSGSATMSSTVMRGLSEPNGSWKMYWTWRRKRAQVALVQRQHVDRPLGCQEGDPAGVGGERRA